MLTTPNFAALGALGALKTLGYSGADFALAGPWNLRTLTAGAGATLNLLLALATPGAYVELYNDGTAACPVQANAVAVGSIPPMIGTVRGYMRLVFDGTTWIAEEIAPKASTLVWGSSTGATDNVLRFLCPGGPGIGNNTTVPSVFSMAMPYACYISNLRIRQNLVGVADTVAYTLYKNGAPTALTAPAVTSASAAGSDSDPTHAVQFAAADTVDMAIQGSNAVMASPATRLVASVQVIRIF